jgi:hypothetical protein
MRKPTPRLSPSATLLCPADLQAIRGGDGETADAIEKARVQNQRRVEFKLVSELSTSR